MFLETVQKRNPALIRAALEYHQSGAIPPNTYLFDYDAVQENARLLADSARAHKLSLFFITKQIGHNPALLEAIQRGGLNRGTAVDITEVYALATNSVHLGNVGHLTQLPTHDIAPVLWLRPDFVTVFGYDKARQVSEAAQKLSEDVALLLRVRRPQDFFYPGQVGGVDLEDVVNVSRAINALPRVRIAGVTSYPCLTFDEPSKKLQPISNLESLLLARDRLAHEGGYRDADELIVDAPGNTCISAMPILASHGVTHAEPGHALTGTTPLHASRSEPEMPALVYVSEVSHVEGQTAYIFGGGFYRRSNVRAALVGSRLEDLDEPGIACAAPASDMIDYYAELRDIPARVKVGDTAILAFRTQLFVTRSYTAAVHGLRSGRPTLLGLWDSRGRPVINGVPHPQGAGGS